MQDRSEFLTRIYKLIDGPRKKYGDFKKCEFHIHTPVSKCYRFFTPLAVEEKDLEGKHLYSDLTTLQVLDYAEKCGYLTKNMYSNIIDELDYYTNDKYSDKLKSDKIPYISFKEYIAYMTIAYKLYKDNIQVALISDHNTVKGYDKLKYALEKYHLENVSKDIPRIQLLLGVEISCSDKNHLMVIFDDERKSELEQYLREIIMGDDIGTYHDTRKIIEDMNKYDAITYIAHANTSKFYGSGIYKKALFNSEGLYGLGVNKLDAIKPLRERVRIYNTNITNAAYILEGDSHAINEMGLKNCWMKLSNIKFKSLKKAFINHQISIYNQEPLKTSIYIKGIVIEKGERGFLGPSPNKKVNRNHKDYMVIDFARDLNCIIGGKGTGKSTILNILETIYSQETDNIDILNYISQHRKIYSLFVKSNREYLLEFIPQLNIRGSYYNIPMVNKNSYIKDNEIYKLQPYWYNLFEVNNINNKITYNQVKDEEVSHILKNVFRRGYNINKLVDKISNKQISNYIRDVITYNVKYEDINTYIQKIKKANSQTTLKAIRESLSDIIEMINKRKIEFIRIVEEFNKKNENIINIEYKPMDNHDEYFDSFLDIFEKNRGDNYYSTDDKNELRKNIDNTFLTWGDIQTYFIAAMGQWNYFEILHFILNKKLSEMNKILPLVNFEGMEESFKTVELGLVHVSNDNIKQLNTLILRKIIDNRDRLKESIIKCFKVVDNFDIKFNINYKEDIQNLQPILKSIKYLSLGQKVAALLTFVFNFGSITNDNTPLIIDQPEDNLDNTYIYKTLVQSLKLIKNSRQVIIVTHSSTIVTNADAEEVIVLKSDSKNGWIENAGYPSEDIITKHIINYLEGGQESFKHKYNMYKTIINS